ncbi:MAG: aminotransferase class V-fold PLP-dependent enzyme [Dehalococcoidia bacterium]|nr:aminotransferase class V-fold PLP-dependent enzyme [Dehalococcoidia bacterium]|tara:strand:- start:466 stop:1635 length:1170 start_codon:yes stop_codon:yes gene_type:complete
MPNVDIDEIRSQIPVLAHTAYMNTGWSGPAPRRVAQAMKDRIDLELEQGTTTSGVYEAGKEIQEQAQAAVARIFNASIDEVMVTRNTTEGLNIVLSGLDWQQGDEIIICDMEHGSVIAPAQLIGQRYGVAVKVVDLEVHDSSETIATKIVAAFTPKTRMVFISHILYATGRRMPAEEIRRATKDRGILMMLDGAQTGGHIELDMARSGFDFYSIPGQKWLLGYEGSGALYIRREHLERIHPAHTGGRAIARPANAHNFQPVADSMEKFLGGSVSVPVQAAFLEATKFIEEAGIYNIETRNLDLAESAKAKLSEVAGVTVLSPSERRDSSGLVTFAVEGQTPISVVERLWEDHKIVVRQVGHPAGVRASLHFFNTEEEVELLVGGVRELA